MSSIRIVRTPPGFAPLEVREQWIGVEITLVTPEELSVNPLSGFRLGNENIDGHLVFTASAIAALKAAGKAETAEFWQNMGIGMYLQFNAKACEYVE